MLYLVKTIKDELMEHELWLRTDGKHGRRADFSGRSLSGENFSGKDLRKALFINAELIGCRFAGANLSGAYFSRAKVAGCDFHHAGLQKANFEKVQMMESKLDGALLHGAIFRKGIISHTTMWQAVVDGTDFAAAKLVGLNLNGLIRLSDPEFSGAKLTDCIVACASGAKLRNCRPYKGARYVTARRGGCSIEGFMELIDLHEIFLKNRESFDLDFSDTVLQGLDLQGRDLRGIRFRNTLFKNVNLAKARLDGCDFAGCSFDNVITVGATGAGQ